jgi:RNA polymerase sigma-70 factor (ECF subfamily)
MNTITSDAGDQADMARLVEGHDAALEALMARHGERLFHYLIRVLQDESTAADLVQETFTRVYLHRGKFKAGRKFSTWLYTIATNLARDHRRWRSRHPEISLESDDDSDTGLKNVLPAPGPTPTENLEQDERADAVRRALAALPEDLRVPLVLAEYEDQSHAEIAAVLDCSPKAVEMRLYRARQQLRESLASLVNRSDPDLNRR